MDNPSLYDTNVDVTRRHTFAIPTRAAGWGEYASVGQLRLLLRHLRENGIPYMPIGQGSNLLFLHDYPGVLLHAATTGIELLGAASGEVRVRVAAGVVWDDWVAHCVAAGWYGVENLSLIPGVVGAAAVQNIGAYGVEACDVIADVEALQVATGELRHFTPEECSYGYRSSIFKHELRGAYIVTAVTFRLSLTPAFKLDYGNLHKQVGDRLSLQAVRDAVIAIRSSKLPDPSLLGSAGSFFVNPLVARDHYAGLLRTYPDMPHYPVDSRTVKVPAGWLIDRCGWRGKSVGGAMVYPRQCLVIVNTGNATAGDVVQLADAIAASVRDTYGIEIKPEVNYIG